MTPRRPFWVVATLSGLVLIGGLITGKAIFFQFLYFFLLLALVALIWASTSLSKINFHRVARTLRQQAGSVFSETFKLENESQWTRLWVEVEDKSGFCDEKKAVRVFTSIEGWQEKDYSNENLLGVRGEYALGPTQLNSGDPFGLFRKRKIIQAQQSLLVLPYFLPLKRFPNPRGDLSGGRAQRHSTQEITPYAAGVRDYQPGDSLSRIHWRSTARRNRLIVKEFEQDPEANVWVFLDGCATKNEKRVAAINTRNGNGKGLFHLPEDTFEYSVSIAASLVDYYIRAERAVGFVCAGQNLVIYLPERGERQYEKIFQTLAFIQPLGDLPITALVQSQLGNLGKGNTAVIVTAEKESSKDIAVQMLKRRGANPILMSIIFDSTSQEDMLQILEDQGLIVKFLVGESIETGFRNMADF